MNLNLKAKAENTFDAIVIGSGISGGWAAKEFTEKGLKTLMLERGRKLDHVKDYTTAWANPWDLPHRGQLPREMVEKNPVISKCYAFREDAAHLFVKDDEHPYVQEKPFDWIRGYQVGGKSLMWARYTQRWSQHDFDGPAKDGFAVEWPIGYQDLAPWYSYVEKFAGISGNRDGLAALPDSEVLPPMEMNCIEQHFKGVVESKFKNRHLIISRTANLSEARPEHRALGRGMCQRRDLCHRGCPFGAYFSTQSSTLPAAARTGNLTLKTDSVVHSIIFDEQKGRAVGVRVIDANTEQSIEYFAKVVFVNAAALNTLLILQNSVSSRFPNGLGNDSGVLGHYVAFHNYRVRARGVHEGFQDKYTYGKRPVGIYMPRFRNILDDRQTAFIRGYAVSGGGGRGRVGWADGFGANLKEALTQIGPWTISLQGMGETIPQLNHTAKPSKTKTDAWGIPQLELSIGYTANDEAMVADMKTTLAEMLEAAGFRDVNVSDSQQAPGLDIHEMGGCRMGKDPKTSMLNGLNQMHAVKNVFVTDGACMTSTSTQNPSLTYMALTARAVDFAVGELKKGNL
ncbi:MAG: GMC family oxidoreductase [Bernardetiaceae bacterium]|jgi:choline dehydrogenase-like flavoprotein|nr:GMC family oxidoreductase [Bernardetiaceae bacterium]